MTSSTFFLAVLKSTIPATTIRATRTATIAAAMRQPLPTPLPDDGAPGDVPGWP